MKNIKFLSLLLFSCIFFSCSKEINPSDCSSNQFLTTIVAEIGGDASKVSINGELGQKLFWEKDDIIYVTSALAPGSRYHAYKLIGDGGSAIGNFEIVDAENPIEIIPGDSYLAYYGTENAQISYSGTTKFLNLPAIPKVQEYISSGYVPTYLNIAGVSNIPGKVNFENNSSVFRVRLTSTEELTISKVSLIGTSRLTGSSYFAAENGVVSDIQYNANSESSASLFLNDTEGDLTKGDIIVNLVINAGTQDMLSLLITLDDGKLITFRKSAGKTFEKGTIYDFGTLDVKAENAGDPVIVSTDQQENVIIDELSSFYESIVYVSGSVTVDDINSSLTHYAGEINLAVSFGNDAVFDGGNKWPSCEIFNSVYKTKMTSISLPNNVTELTGMEVRPSFWSARMTGLREIEFPGLTKIQGNSICFGVNGRLKITLPPTLTTINVPITGVSNFVSLNTNYVVGQDGALYTLNNNLIALPSTMTSYTFEDGIGMCARNCLDGSAITSVVFNDRSTFGVGAIGVQYLNTIIYTTDDYPAPSFGKQVVTSNVGVGGTIYIPSTADRSQYEYYLAYLLDEARGSNRWVIDNSKTYSELSAIIASITPLTEENE